MKYFQQQHDSKQTSSNDTEPGNNLRATYKRMKRSPVSKCLYYYLWMSRPTSTVIKLFYYISSRNAIQQCSYKLSSSIIISLEWSFVCKCMLLCMLMNSKSGLNYYVQHRSLSCHGNYRPPPLAAPPPPPDWSWAPDIIRNRTRGTIYIHCWWKRKEKQQKVWTHLYRV